MYILLHYKYCNFIRKCQICHTDPYITAITTNNLEMIKYCIENDVELKMDGIENALPGFPKNKHACTKIDDYTYFEILLLICIYYDNKSIFEYLIDNYDYNVVLLKTCSIIWDRLYIFKIIKDDNKVTNRYKEMLMSIAYGKINFVKYLYNTDFVIKKGDEAIFYNAIVSGNADVVKYVLSRYSIFNIHTDNDKALYYAAVVSGNRVMIQLLLDYHADPLANNGYILKECNNKDTFDYLVDHIKSKIFV
jgi:hypothetical protein